MNLLDDFTKAFVTFTAALWGFAVFQIASSVYRETVWLFALVLTIPLAFIINGYVKKRNKHTQQSG